MRLIDADVLKERVARKLGEFPALAEMVYKIIDTMQTIEVDEDDRK